MPSISIRHISRFIVLFAFIPILLFAQQSKFTDSVIVPFYPLHIGDRWEFNGELSKVIKDTVMPNNKSYAMIVHSDAILGETRYERVDSGRVYRFNPKTLTEELWFDFLTAGGDTSSLIARPDEIIRIITQATETMYIFGKERNVRYFSIINSNKDYEEMVTIADSLGIIQYYPSNFFPFEEVTASGVVINGKLIRESYPSIYLPLNPGNWWKFDDEPGMVNVLKDTLMPNNKTYAMILWGSVPKYFRQDKHLVFRYNTASQDEEIEMDMSAPAQQIWDLKFWNEYLYVFISGGIRTSTVFSTNKKIYGYGGYYPQIWDAGTGYTYADSIGIVDYSVSLTYSEVVEAYVNGKHYVLTSVKLQQNTQPAKFNLSQNYPNPFNPNTTIKFSIPKAAVVELKIFDALGREIQKLVDEKLQEGTYQVQWHANDKASGMYFYRFKSGSIVETSKMILLK